MPFEVRYALDLFPAVIGVALLTFASLRSPHPLLFVVGACFVLWSALVLYLRRKNTGG